MFFHFNQTMIIVILDKNSLKMSPEKKKKIMNRIKCLMHLHNILQSKKYNIVQ